MKNKEPLRIIVAETSVIVRSGTMAVLKRIPDQNMLLMEASTPESLQNCLRLHTPDLLIVNPAFGGWFDLNSFHTEAGMANVKCISLVCSMFDNNLLKDYDDILSICDDTYTFSKKINRLFHCPAVRDNTGYEQEALSNREKEVIVCVVKGMTNKEIAAQLYLSVHTVITHRRNIARKLQIHSSSGLTIYAILNKLVELQDIRG